MESQNDVESNKLTSVIAKEELTAIKNELACLYTTRCLCHQVLHALDKRWRSEFSIKLIM